MIPPYDITDGTDFREIGPFQVIDAFLASLPAGVRRQCFSISITDDDIPEGTESFTAILELDPFTPQSGILVTPNVTEIFILDDDG